ncbi:MAG TPA: hypothetical protein V6C58_17730 [Allocoleopsis sp.]
MNYIRVIFEHVVNMRRFPCEILEIIGLYLPPKDLMNLKKCSSEIKEIFSKDNNVFWRKKLFKDFKNIKTFTGQTKNIWFDIYRHYYKNKCVECNTLTYRQNFFYNVKVCQRCEKKCSRYKTINVFNCYRKYNVTKEQLTGLKFLYKRNEKNLFKPIKIYLEEDVKELSKRVVS